MDIGSTFILPTPPKGDHIFFAIAKNAGGEYLCVNLSSIYDGSETACIINQRRDMPYVRHRSIIFYQKPRVISEERINALIEKGQCRFLSSLPKDVLQRIQLGGVNSVRMPEKHQKVLMDFLEQSKQHI